MGTSANEDKVEGAVDKAKGRVREAAGALTGDSSEKNKGKGEQLKGRSQEQEGPPEGSRQVVVPVYASPSGVTATHSDALGQASAVSGPR